MLTRIPVPTWRDLAEALVRTRRQPDALARPWCDAGDVAGWLSRSAWSLALIARWRQRSTGLVPCIWLPDYFCNGSLVPLRRQGARIVLYPVRADLTVDEASCTALATHARPDVIVAVHWFGAPSSAIDALERIARDHSAWLVEDAAHALRPAAGMGQRGDFVLYSPHKHLPVPDGAVLVVRRTGPGALGASMDATITAVDTWPRQLDDLCAALGAQVDGRLVASLRWLAKRVAQRLGARRPAATSQRFDDDETAAARLPAPRQSALGRRMVGVFVDRLGSIARHRLLLQRLWNFMVAPPAGELTGVGPRDWPTGDEWTPYLAAFAGAEPAIRSAHERWVAAKLPVTTWPDLPPEVSGTTSAHGAAWRLRHTRLFLPVHHGIEARDIVHASRWQATSPAARVTLDREGVSPQAWNDWLRTAGRSNLLQSWAYGDAKEATSPWRVRRMVFRHGTEPIAVMQCLTRRVAGVASVTRVNRGPLAVRPLAPDEVLAIHSHLARFGSRWRGRVVSIAPELDANGENLAMLAATGFRRMIRRHFESIWVDLGKPIDMLRDEMRGSWRKAMKDLDAPERKGITVEVSTGPDAIDWMLERHATQMRERQFAGAPVDLVRALGAHEDGPLLVLRAWRDETAIAGACLALHGSAATYLIGWSSDAGRKTAASQMLLWAAVKALQGRGLSGFDLGGIDDENTPGISAFKRGLGGTAYQLIGEYWRA